jgi:hypothetical protein
MLRQAKDLFTRIAEVTNAWEKMRPEKQFFGLTVEGFKEACKPFLEARKEIADLEPLWTHAFSKRDNAEKAVLEILQGVVLAVKGDPTEGQNGALVGAMGYVPKNQRATGLVRGRKGKPTRRRWCREPLGLPRRMAAGSLARETRAGPTLFELPFVEASRDRPRSLLRNGA